MRSSTFWLIGFCGLVVASPMPSPQGTGNGADSCPSEALTTETWTKLKIDDFLVEASKNYTRSQTNNVQSLAASFGAPNFFCGLDSFCNAGQPCLPIRPPAWYAAIAIQNWNNYMNSLNTALTFASSILSLKLGEIVKDVMPQTVDNVTPMKSIGQFVAAMLGTVPFTGPLSTIAATTSGTLGYVLLRIKPPAPADKFLLWSNVASSMGDIVQEYQGIIADSIKATIDAEIDDANNGINTVIKGGSFLGVSQNFTQSDLQDAVIDSLVNTGIGMALQAQKMFVTRFFNRQECNRDDPANELCRQNEGSETFTIWQLLKSDGDGLAQPQTDIAKTLLEKYGFTKDQLLKGPTDCFDGNGKRQLVNPLDVVGALPTDPKAPCVTNMLVCDIDVAAGTGNRGIVDFCREDQGLDI